MEYVLEYFKVQESLHIHKNTEKMCFFAFTLSNNRKHRLEMTRIIAHTPEEAYKEGLKLGEWIDFWKNEVFPTLRVK